MSKHIVCCANTLNDLIDVLSEENKVPGKSGREMLLCRRAGQIKELWVVQLPICPMMSPASELFSKSAEFRLSDEMVDSITAPPLVQLMDCQSRDEIWEFIKEQEDSRRSKREKRRAL